MEADYDSDMDKLERGRNPGELWWYVNWMQFYDAEDILPCMYWVVSSDYYNMVLI